MNVFNFLSSDYRTCHATEYCPIDPCPGGIAVRGSCYRLFNFRQSWSDAQAFCQNYNSNGFVGGRLGAVYTSTHQAALRAYLSTAEGLGQPFTNDVWLGGKLQDPERFTGLAQRMWRWVSGNTFKRVTLLTACSDTCTL